ncbi:MAG: hypothetical protein QOH91_3433 [Mycobacterium sp.]|nr:hypothetical protein [Mycobacterium sp.]
MDGGGRRGGGAAEGCTTRVGGAAGKAKETDSANVSLMDTGTYPTTLGHIFGTAGDDKFAQSVLEAHRLADSVIGPWQIDETIAQFPLLELLVQIGDIPTAPNLERAFGPVFSDVAAKHGYITGFSTKRVSPGTPPSRGLTNAVLRFADPAAAAAAAAELAAANPTLPQDSPHEPAVIDKHPEAMAVRYLQAGGNRAVDSFTAHGSYVLYQTAFNSIGHGSETTPELLILACLDRQTKLIDQFVPTDPANLSSLPVDPSGRILAATLVRDGAKLPFNAGVWQRAGWLHFAVDPAATAAALQSAGVDYVAQRLATVYQATNADAAPRLMKQIVNEVSHGAGVQPISDPVPGFPAAQCFSRTGPTQPPDAPATWRMMQWHFKCVARAARYAYTVFSDTEKDVMQQVSAQYRILAGK